MVLTQVSCINMADVDFPASLLVNFSSGKAGGEEIANPTGNSNDCIFFCGIIYHYLSANVSIFYYYLIASVSIFYYYLSASVSICLRRVTFCRQA